MLPRASAHAQQEPADATAEPDRPAPLFIAGNRQAVPAQAVPAHPAVASSSARSPGAATSSARSYVTARGAMVTMFGLFLVTNLLAGWLGHAVLAGLGYAAACIMTPYLVRRHALLQVVVAPPAIFLAALVIAQMATAQGTGRHGKVLSVLEGTVLTLAALAPWLVGGTALGACLAIPRGLRQCVRELSSELRADVAERRPWAPRQR